MKNTEKQFTRNGVIEHGEYLGCIEYGSGATGRRRVPDGIVFAGICNADGYRAGFRRLGKASKVSK